MSKSKTVLLALLAVVIAAAIAVGVMGCAGKSQPAASSNPPVTTNNGQATGPSPVSPTVPMGLSIRSRCRLISSKRWRGWYPTAPSRRISQTRWSRLMPRLLPNGRRVRASMATGFRATGFRATDVRPETEPHLGPTGVQRNHNPGPRQMRLIRRSVRQCPITVRERAVPGSRTQAAPAPGRQPPNKNSITLIVESNIACRLERQK